MEPRGKLDLAGIGDLAGYGAGARRSDGMVWQAEIGMVESVEGLNAELHSESFGNGEILVQAEIPGFQAGPDQNVATCVSESVLGRVDKTSNIEPFMDALFGR